METFVTLLFAIPAICGAIFMGVVGFCECVLNKAIIGFTD